MRYSSYTRVIMEPTGDTVVALGRVPVEPSGDTVVILWYHCSHQEIPN